MNNKMKVIKVNIMGQDYFIKSSENATYFKKISKYVNSKIDEIIDSGSGIDPTTQQLKIAVFTCMSITEDLFTAQKDSEELIDQIASKSSSIIEYIDENLNTTN